MLMTTAGSRGSPLQAVMRSVIGPNLLPPAPPKPAAQISVLIVAW